MIQHSKLYWQINQVVISTQKTLFCKLFTLLKIILEKFNINVLDLERGNRRGLMVNTTKGDRIST